MTAIPSPTAMPCVEKGPGPSGPIAADIPALCSARLRGATVKRQLTRPGGVGRPAASRQSGGLYTDPGGSCTCRGRAAAQAARISPMGAARRPRPGRRALHADLTAHLPAGGTGPFRMHNGMTIITEAEIRGHRLAAEITQARTDCWFSVILSDDLQLNWADAKSTEKMILGCVKQPGFLQVSRLRKVKSFHRSITACRYWPSSLRRGHVSGALDENWPASLRPNTDRAGKTETRAVMAGISETGRLTGDSTPTRCVDFTHLVSHGSVSPLWRGAPQ